MSDLSQAGRIILTVPLAAGIIAFVAFQWSTTHVFNPKWHLHARFHAVQLGLFFIALSGIGLWLIWGSTIGLPTAAWLAAAVPIVFWGELSAALPIPGTDPSPNPANLNTFPLLGGPRARQPVLLRLHDRLQPSRVRARNHWIDGVPWPAHAQPGCRRPGGRR